MDATKNEVRGLIIDSYPTIKFYKKGNKDDPVLYEDDLQLENLERFVNK